MASGLLDNGAGAIIRALREALPAGTPIAGDGEGTGAGTRIAF